MIIYLVIVVVSGIDGTSSVGTSVGVVDGIIVLSGSPFDDTNFLYPNSEAPIKTKLIDCVIISLVLVIHILSIHPSKKHKVPTKHITKPAVPEPLDLPVLLEQASAHENFDISIIFFYFL